MDFATNFYIYLFFPLTLLFYWFIKKINRVKLTEVFLLMNLNLMPCCLKLQNIPLKNIISANGE